MTDDLINLTADIVSAHASNNRLSTSELSALIRNVFDALSDAATPAPAEPPKPEPAVSIRSSVKRDHIVCLEDGVKLKMLKRHLRTGYDMSPAEYRAKWGLPADYPMIAPAYAEHRRALAVKAGLGQQRRGRPPTAERAPGKRARPAKPTPEN